MTMSTHSHAPGHTIPGAISLPLVSQRSTKGGQWVLMKCLNMGLFRSSGSIEFADFSDASLIMSRKSLEMSHALGHNYVLFLRLWREYLARRMS